MSHTQFPKLGLGSVGRFNNGQFVEADDEAFVSSEGEDPDYEIAIKGPEAHRLARLITAAPDLLDALKTVFSLYGAGWADDARDYARAAITKATGAA